MLRHPSRTCLKGRHSKVRSKSHPFPDGLCAREGDREGVPHNGLRKAMYPKSSYGLWSESNAPPYPALSASSWNLNEVPHQFPQSALFCQYLTVPSTILTLKHGILIPCISSTRNQAMLPPQDQVLHPRNHYDLGVPQAGPPSLFILESQSSLVNQSDCQEGPPTCEQPMADLQCTNRSRALRKAGRRGCPVFRSSVHMTTMERFMPRAPPLGHQHRHSS